MKLALLVSLLGNAVLVVVAILFVSRPEPTKPEIGVVDDSSGAEASIPALVETAPAGARVSPEEPARDLVEALVAAGWSKEDAEVFGLGRKLQARLVEALGFDGERDYWESHVVSSVEAMRLSEALGNVIEDELGLQLIERLHVEAYPIDPEKVRQVARIYHDYEMIRKNVGGGVAVSLPGDRPEWELIREEFLRDVSAILSPEEIFEFEMRHSHFSEFLRGKLQNVAPTEEEFRQIARLHYESNLREATDDPEERRQRQQTREKRMEEILGEERHRQFVREGQHYYTQISGIAEHLSLPLESANRAFDLREDAQRWYNEIQSSGGTVDERREMQARLQAETRQELTELLGEQGFELFQKHAGLHWLE